MMILYPPPTMGTLRTALHMAAKSASRAAVWFGSSSCTACPTVPRGSVTISMRNLPCICAIVSGLSNRSVLARISNLAAGTAKNLLDRSLNHPEKKKERRD